MSKFKGIELECREASADPLTEALRTDAQELIQQAVEKSSRNCWSSIPNAVPRLATLGLCAAVICLSASCRLVWDR